MALAHIGKPAWIMASVAALALGSGGAEAQQFTCPKKGGDFVFGQQAKVNSLDTHTSAAASTRNIAMSIFETLLIRDENFAVMPNLAASVETSADGKTYVFKLRPGVKFHNGKPLTTADVVATFDRYKQMGIDRGMLAPVDKWEARDASTFVIHMKTPQPTFLENLSSFLVPVAIIPAENATAPAMQLPSIGTGPFELVENVADSHVKLKRFDGYTPDTRYNNTDGFAGYRVACVDTVTYRIVTEPGARVAGIETGGLHAVEDLPVTSQARLKENKNIVLTYLNNFWIQVAEVNISAAPTDNLKFRQAIQAVLNMDEIMESASDGAFRLNVGFQYPGQSQYTDAGKETYNQKNPAKAKQLLTESGYKGEEVVLLTNKDYTSMYNASLVVAEQLKAIGINVKLSVVDWPAAAQTWSNSATGWNLFFNASGNGPVQGPVQTIRQYAAPQSAYKPKTPADADKPFNDAFDEMVNGATPDIRKAAFARAQVRLLDQVLVLPFGALNQLQAVRSNVKNFRPYRIQRAANVYFD
ncbi:MAG: ABC transporter substrate-binding protein [Alphaproteobacteria bacterium]|nr:ABC transporter substrate-binding protein [Alphaproteobacteria bacterium]